jgi:uncharacterized protein YjbI with pentapeptide repeats
MELESGETYSDFEIQGTSIAGRLRMLDLKKGRFVDCDLSNAEWELPALKEITFQRCRITGFRMLRGRGTQVTFRECRGRYLQLERCELKDSRFEECELVESSFVDCQLPEAVIRGCDLTDSVFTGSRFPKADLRESRLGGLRATWAELAGVTLDPEQAVAVLQGHAGIAVLPPGFEPGH